MAYEIEYTVLLVSSSLNSDYKFVATVLKHDAYFCQQLLE